MIPPLLFYYVNYEGKVALRRVDASTIGFHFNKTQHHPQPQYLMTAFDLDKDALRDFAVADILRFVKEDV